MPVSGATLPPPSVTANSPSSLPGSLPLSSLAVSETVVGSSSLIVTVSWFASLSIATFG